MHFADKLIRQKNMDEGKRVIDLAEKLDSPYIRVFPNNLPKNEDAKEMAIQLYQLIIEHSYDKENGGYIEALTVDWKEIKDLRLSAKDANEKKSMNTYLHVLEGFANLYRIWANEVLKNKIAELVHLFLNYIIA